MRYSSRRMGFFDELFAVHLISRGSEGLISLFDRIAKIIFGHELAKDCLQMKITHTCTTKIRLPTCMKLDYVGTYTISDSIQDY